MTTTLIERTATPSFTETDARAAVAAIVAAEGLPAPTHVTVFSTRRPRVGLVMASRDAVDEWAAMLGVGTYRSESNYQLDADALPMHSLLPGVVLDVFCAVAPISWRPRQTAQVSA
ncbi:hypothetical protein Cme02nite_38710 [Catellatospora methionotrophica]|uniref:Uncharacterized protein n=1 Tax=Catellatospora methionotrophica TaxID=121620 RepID=A0A8J3LBX7_9ACTN|nr:hypothetical protein [Catellatospora methionotrophica]GIG15539.1 hypothetical protein Cme02nite_38710 [Catellatospora methionotrophica]